MSRGKSSIIARLASLGTVFAVSAFLMVGCGRDDGGDDNKDGNNPVTNHPNNNNNNTDPNNNNNNNNGGNGGGTVEYGSFSDGRDGKTYKTVKIGTQTWMAENLNIQTSGSWCYDYIPANCAKYGRLYTWDAAMTACPRGWHLPTTQEWDMLMTAVGGSSTAGTKLKSKSPNWDGTDDYGFSALPGGRRLTVGSFFNLGSYGGWWAATEYVASYAWLRVMDSGITYVSEYADVKSYGFSVRCLQD
jgi:uncharacterized protein (TIGR02145 family)